MLSKNDIKSFIKQFNIEDFNLSVQFRKSKLTRSVKLTRWHNNKPETLGYLTITMIALGLWEVDHSMIKNKAFIGHGKLLYYVAMSSVYPDYITPSGEGVSSDAVRIYKAFDMLDYVESAPLLSDFCGVDVCKDEFEVINKQYRFSLVKD